MPRNVLQKESRMYVSSAVSFCSGCIKKARLSNLNLITEKMRATLKPGNRNPESESGNREPESGIENDDREVHFSYT